MSATRTLLAVFLGGALGCAALGAAPAGGSSSGATGPAAADDGEAAVDRLIPDLVMKPLVGREEIRLASLRGKVVLLDVWASWCPPCREEMPLLDDLAKRLRGERIEIIAVSVDEDRAAAQKFLRARRKWTLTLAHDPSVADRLKPPSMPSSYLIDDQGRVRAINAGFERGDIARIEARLRALAAGGR